MGSEIWRGVFCKRELDGQPRVDPGKSWGRSWWGQRLAAGASRRGTRGELPQLPTPFPHVPFPPPSQSLPPSFFSLYRLPPSIGSLPPSVPPSIGSSSLPLPSSIGSLPPSVPPSVLLRLLLLLLGSSRIRCPSCGASCCGS
eukprot:837506-Pyramimonas_sp.AAC.1